MTASLRPLAFAEVMDSAFAIYRRHFAVMYATALIAAAPAAAFGALGTHALWGGGGASVVVPMLALALLGTACTLATWGALLRQASRAVLGQAVTLGDGLRAGLRAAPRLLAQGVVLGMAWFAFSLISVGGFGGGLAAVATAGPLAAVLIVGVVLGGIIGGQLAFLALVCAAPLVVVLERRGPFEAISRSLELGRGSLPRGMALIGICGVIMLLPPIAMAFLTSLLVPATSEAAGRAVALRLAVQQAGSLLAGSVTLPFLAIALTVLYYDRRVRQEALDVQLLAEGLAAG